MLALRKGNPGLYAHLHGPGPKRMLGLDGGGVLGVIEIAFLEEIERLLRHRTRNPRLVLSEYFDLIGGTSTGAIIATALALGMTAAQVKNLYFDFAPAVFKSPLIPIEYVFPKFDSAGLGRKLREVLGERQLRSEDLRTGLAIVTKRVDTGSPWVLTNNPRSRYWNDGEIDKRTGRPTHIANKRYRLRDLVRASTAAPFYFSPHKIRIADGVEGLFVDGGISPHNNPSLQLLMLAGIDGYGFNWKIGKDDLLLISIGAGWTRPTIFLEEGTRSWAVKLAAKTLETLVWDGNVNTLTLLQWMSEPRCPWPINSEIGTLQGEFLGVRLGGKELFRFQRYDVALDRIWIKEKLGVEISSEELERLKRFMDPGTMEKAYVLGQIAAAKQVAGEDFPEHFDPQQPPRLAAGSRTA
jgi:hypothetical protein